ncbi:hypothetical protein GCM10022226_00470 [Sphaerisporangium flaviroseum]|uniref:Uncharacterized protein n=1 Tax=Sphaerisporangium flaviroseum TaxID=509199 RepID=A0ABP7H8G2_9ACTN
MERHAFSHYFCPISGMTVTLSRTPGSDSPNDQGRMAAKGAKSGTPITPSVGREESTRAADINGHSALDMVNARANGGATSV